LAPFAVASNNNLNPVSDDDTDNGNTITNTDISNTSSAKVVEANGNVQQQNGNVNNKYKNQLQHNHNNHNNNNSILVREEVNINYDENHRVIEKSVTLTVHKAKVNSSNSEQNSNSIQKTQNRVKFLDEDNMNQNLTASQPLVSNGHLANAANTNLDLEASQKLASSHPHVTISSHHDMAKNEDRNFGTKIDNSYQGWDNPFRPEGELSHDAEEILRLWKEGKLKDFSLLLKAKEDKNGPDSLDGGQDHSSDNDPLLLNNSHEHGPSNGVMKNGSSGKNGIITDNVKTSQMPPPLKSEKVTVMAGDGPKKKKGCCSLM